MGTTRRQCSIFATPAVVEKWIGLPPHVERPEKYYPAANFQNSFMMPSMRVCTRRREQKKYITRQNQTNSILKSSSKRQLAVVFIAYAHLLPCTAAGAPGSCQSSRTRHRPCRHRTRCTLPPTRAGTSHSLQLRHRVRTKEEGDDGSYYNRCHM